MIGWYFLDLSCPETTQHVTYLLPRSCKSRAECYEGSREEMHCTADPARASQAGCATVLDMQQKLQQLATILDEKARAVDVPDAL